MVEEFFKDGLAPTAYIGFQSGYTLSNRLDSMIQTPPWYKSKADFRLKPAMEFYLQNIIDCIKYLISQCAFVQHISWAPVRTKSYDST